MDDLTLIMQGKSGDITAVNELWERHQGLIRQQVTKLYFKNKSLADHVGVELDDLLCAGWFSVRDTVRRYNPEKHVTFTTALGWSIRSTVSKTLLTSRMKYIIDERGKKVCIPADPLNYALSTDIPLEEETDSTLTDLYPDTSIDLESDFENKLIRLDVEKALQKLTYRQRTVLQMRFRDGCTLQETADFLYISRQAAHQLERTALKKFKAALNTRNLYDT